MSQEKLTVAPGSIPEVLKLVMTPVLGPAGIDWRLSSEAALEEGQQVLLGQTLADALCWLIFLLFLPAILGALASGGLVQSAQPLGCAWVRRLSLSPLALAWRDTTPAANN
jgi:hypothetical protein